MNYISGPAIILFLEILLATYFVYTVIAIFKGAAPIPSRNSTVKRLLALAEIKPGEQLIDLGSGDGRILFAAAKLGANCTGIEINPFLILYTRLRAKLLGVKTVRVLRENLWTADISNVDVMTIYMVPQYMGKLKAKVQAEMKPGSRIVAAVYPFPDWEPVKQDGNTYLFRVEPRH